MVMGNQCIVGLVWFTVSWLPITSHAEEQDNVARITWESTSKKLYIEPGKKIFMYIKARDQAGNGLANLDLQLGATTGKLSKARHIGKGRYRITYRMPQNIHPQAVILHASTARTPPVWTVLRLWSKITLPVNTNKPNVRITLKLGERSYGPASTDAEGKASLNVEIGPGESQAVVHAIDAFGNRSQKTIRVPTPSFPRIAASADRTTLEANGRDKSVIYIYAIKPDGTSLEKKFITSACSPGICTKIVRASRRSYQMEYTAPSQIPSSPVSIVITADDQAPPKKVYLAFELIPAATPIPSMTPPAQSHIQTQEKIDTAQDTPPILPSPSPRLSQKAPSSAWLSFGPSTGWMYNFTRLHWISILFEGKIGLPFGRPNLYFALSSGYRFGKQTSQVGSADISLEIDVETLPVYASFYYKLPIHSRVSLHASFGGGIELVHWSLSRQPDLKERGFCATSGLVSRLGTEIRIGHQATLVFSVGYLYAYLNDRSTSDSEATLQGSRLKGNLGGMEILCGYRMHL